MASVFKSLILLVVLAGLALGGFWAGHELRNKTGVTPIDTLRQHLPDVKVTDYLPPTPRPPAEPQDGPYAAMPAVAPLARSVWAEDLKEKDGIITATIPIENADRVEKGREIVFYARRPYELLSGVSYIDSVESDDTHVRATFSMPDNLTLPLKRVRARILTMETVGTKQLPLSALHYDDEGNAYVWKLERIGDAPAGKDNESEGEFAALYHPVFAGIKGDDAFEVGSEVQMGQMVLAGTPADIENGQILNITHIAPPPDMTPLTEQARDIQRARNTEKLQAEIWAFEEATGGTGCNASVTESGLPAAISTTEGTIIPPELQMPVRPIPPMQTQIPTTAAPPPAPPAEGCGTCGTTY